MMFLGGIMPKYVSVLLPHAQSSQNLIVNKISMLKSVNKLSGFQKSLINPADLNISSKVKKSDYKDFPLDTILLDLQDD